MSRNDDQMPDPDSIRTVGEYAEALRRVKVYAGDPSYNQLRQRTGIPTSTLSDALNPKRTGLPDLELVRSLLRALEIDPAPWEAAWRRVRLVADAERDAVAPAGAKAEPDREGLLQVRWHRHRRLRWLVVLLPVAAVAALLGITMAPGPAPDQPGRKEDASRPSGTTSPTSPRPALPESGRYRIKLAGSDKCFSENPDREQDGLVYLLECRRIFRVEGVHRITKDTYQIRARHEEHGVGCMGWNDDQDGAVNDSCGTMGKFERFRFEPVAGVRGGYRMHVLAGGCVTVGGGPKDRSAPILRQPCDAANHQQVLTLERR